jgi:hypothetical protein
MSDVHFDNYPSELTGKAQKAKTQIKKALVKINVFLKWVEIVLLPVFLGYFIFLAFTQKTECISGLCQNSWLYLNLGLFQIEYSQSLFNFIIDYAIPFFAIDGLVRIGLTFWINKREGKFEWFFYAGLIGLASCYYLLSRFYESFAYIHAPGTNVSAESNVVELILAVLVVSGFMLFREKYNWDRASFFTKFRLMFYSFHLVVCIANINFGIILFLVSIPFQVLVDFRGRNHVHYHDPLWLER